MTSSIGISSKQQYFAPIAEGAGQEGSNTEQRRAGARSSMSRMQTIVEEPASLSNSSDVKTQREEEEIATIIACYCQQSCVFTRLPNSALQSKGKNTVIELYDSEKQMSCVKSTITPGMFKVKGQIRKSTNPNRKSPYAKEITITRAERGATPTCCKATQSAFYGGNYFI